MSIRVRERIVSAFEEWSVAKGLVPDDVAAVELWRDRIWILLECRTAYLDRPDPTLWRSGDVHRLLMDYLVPRQADAWGLAEYSVETIRDFLLFLEATQRLHPSSMRAATLLKELDRAAITFSEAMADTSRFWLAKRVWTAMYADGLTPDSDDAEADRWVDRFNALDAAGRRKVLGELMDDNPGYATGQLLVHGGKVAIVKAGKAAHKGQIWPDAAERDTGEELPAVPSLQLPPVVELAAAVADSELLRGLSALAEWVGADGRPVDKHGELRGKDVAAVAAAVGAPDSKAKVLWDVPALATLWDLALELGALDLRRTRVVQGDLSPVVQAVVRGAATPEQTLELWDEVFDEVAQPVSDEVSSDLGLLRDLTQPWVPRLLGKLLTQCPGGEFTDVEPLVSGVVGESLAAPSTDDDEVLAAISTAMLMRGLSGLAALGAVDVDVPLLTPEAPQPGDAAASTSGVSPWVLDPPAGLRVRLTDLGRRSVHARFATELAGLQSIG